MSNQWWKDPVAMQDAVNQYGTPTAAAKALGGISEHRARAWAKQFGTQKSDLLAPNASYATPTAPGTTAGSTELIIDQTQVRWSDKDLLEFHGINPDTHIITRRKPKRWNQAIGEGQVAEMNSLALDVVPRADTLLGLQLPTGWTPPTPRAPASQDAPIHVPLFGDPHFPMHEPALYEASLAWLEQFKPPQWVCMGDEGDWSPFKRHKPNRRTDTTLEEAVIGTFDGLAGWAALAPGRLIDGNHTRWLSSRIQENMPSLVGIKRPGDEHELHSLNHILKLPELGITYHEAAGEWFDSQILLADDLVLLHGVKTGKHGGAIKEHDGWEGASICQGHDHSLQLTAISKKTPTGYTQKYAISTGAMSLRDLGYSSAKDVDQGWAVITIWPDGKWHPDFALFNPETQETTWRDWRYAPIK